ncbi:MAG: FAD:protein FMN transferase [Methylococcaceae bacterium]|nr:FAD:protein FMN transferase [Methylococcaceae bacterium]
MELFRYEFKAMGCPCEVQLFADDRRSAGRIADLAIVDVRRLEARYSRYREDSLLSAINAVAARGGGIRVDDETASLLDYAATCHAQSGGLFDITSGILRLAWRFGSGQLPAPETIATLLERVGWHKLRWQPPLLEFPQPGLELDFGGIVKEYAVDRAATLCRNEGARHGLINLGGDIRVIGPRVDGSPWQVGIAHPRKQHQLLETVRLYRGAVASSGDYERCLVVDGVRYSHVLNPTTGWPVRHLAAVTVLGEHCVVAGSACTIAMLLEQDGPEWLASLGLPHLWVDVAGGQGGSLE